LTAVTWLPTAPSPAARIFERFSQADASATREKAGTGLGLYIARRFIEQMQGRIGFDSESGKGATFWVEMTAVPQKA
jgi:signal transduction histidine kinase